MTFDISIAIFFLLLSLLASTINGGLGYGYSSISIPLAILVFASRIINPAYVLLEAILNTVMLFLAGRKNAVAVARRNVPIILAVLPGVVFGSLVLSLVTPLWLRLIVYVVILPLILMQAAGYRRPIKNEKTAGITLGMGVGLLYSLTTISGPPIALFWNNQGLAKNQFKAALAQVRIAESYLTATSYYFLGLFTATSVSLFTVIAPPVLLGLPLGFLIVKKFTVETFRRICMSFDAWIVGYGLSRTLIPTFGISESIAYLLWSGVITIDLVLLYEFFKYGFGRRTTPSPGIPAVERGG